MLCTWVPAVEASDRSGPPWAAARCSSSNSRAERPQVGVDGGRVVAAAADREVPAFDCLAVEVHGGDPRRMSPAEASDAASAGPRGASSARDLPQVAAQLAQLVAQLRGVLEAQLLGGREHLLLELDDHPLELVLRHLLGRAAAWRVRRLRPRGTFDSACRNSAMSEMPLTIVAAVIPCSSL